ncbi:hypothetical protein PENPOL_c012G02445 [Penicillium polonicum]|uniref:Uncharacterized protein n=1 Tax=Penicillium polonicum TaxID=60169 RepID=A0A1V6NDD2_PENPO|nr:hypothetical protein PENPOL_c012G02445 [Penicillium polonicum]
MTSPLEYLTDLEGTEITLDAVTEAPLHIPAQTWVIVEKLREDPCRLTREDVSDGIGVSYTSAKFLCHPAGPSNETKLAFMRIYQQWQDRFFYRFAFALPDRNPGARMPGIERNKADWKEDENGCVW